MRQVGNIVEAANATSNVLFHSVDPQFPLIDFIYQDGKGAFHAFQATTGLRHSAALNHILELEKQVGGAQNLNLYYLVPGDHFDSFVTDPVNPCKVTKGESASCKIWHVRVSDPNYSEKPVPDPNSSEKQ